MIFPVTVSIGNTALPLHIICEVLAFFIAFRYYIFLRNKSGDPISNNNRVWILIAAIFGAFAGSRIVGGLENPTAMLQAKNIFMYFYLNKTVLGGFLGGLFAVEAVKKIIGEKQASGDLFAYPMMLGLIIGRIGCFSMGIYEETYGIPTHFFAGMNLGDGIARHPVTLYEIIYLLLLWILLKKTETTLRLGTGARFKIFLFSYFLFRFLCDFIKPHYNVVFGFSTIQITSLLGIMWYYRYVLHPQLLRETDTSDAMKNT